MSHSLGLLLGEVIVLVNALSVAKDDRLPFGVLDMLPGVLGFTLATSNDGFCAGVLPRSELTETFADLKFFAGISNV